MVVEVTDIPALMLVAGIPATGKSSFSEYLHREWGYVHLDFDRLLQGQAEWPSPDLFGVLRGSPSRFIETLADRHGHAVVDWGFPLENLVVVRSMLSVGAKFVWFDGDIGAAKGAFARREAAKPNGTGQPIENFDHQVAAIKFRWADIAKLKPLVVLGLGPDGAHRPPEEVLEEVCRLAGPA